MSTELEVWGAQEERAVFLSLGGLTAKDIAETLGRPIEWVQATLDDSRALEAAAEFEQKIVQQAASRGAEVHMKFRALAGEALDIVKEIMLLSESEGMRLKAATTILDRAGFTAVQRSITVGTQIPADVAERMEKAMIEMSAIEADYSIIPAPGEKIADA